MGANMLKGNCNQFLHTHMHTQTKDMLSTNRFHLLLFCIWANHLSFSSCEWKKQGFNLHPNLRATELVERIAPFEEKALRLQEILMLG